MTAHVTVPTTVPSTATCALGLDIGGTKVAGALVDAGGTVLDERRAPTPRTDPDPEALFRAVEGVLSGLLSAASARNLDVAGVGLSSAGPIDVVAGTVSPINIAGWRAFPLVERVRAVLGTAGRGGLPVVLAGDGTAMILAEQRYGAARGLDDVLGMVVSTGIGGGLVLGGQAFRGRTGNAGHLGHVVVEPAGLRCTCGGYGCLETVASGPNAVRWALAHGWAPRDPAPRTGEGLAAAARAGDQVAAAAIARAGRAVGEMIAGVAATDDLSAAVIGGGFAQSGELLFGPVRAAVARHAGLSFLAGFRVLAAELGPGAGVVGAAALINH